MAGGTAVRTTAVDGVPHRVLATERVTRLERGGRLGQLVTALRNAAEFRRTTGQTWGELLRECHQQGAYTGIPIGDALANLNAGAGEDGEAGGGEEEAALAQDLEELLLDDELPAASEAFQQEGMEMPEHDS